MQSFKSFIAITFIIFKPSKHLWKYTKCVLMLGLKCKNIQCQYRAVETIIYMKIDYLCNKKSCDDLSNLNKQFIAL